MTTNYVSLPHSFDWRRLAHSADRFELLLLGIAAPVLFFPNRWTPLAFALVFFTWLVRWLAFGRLT
ncbi:MAG: hypothetical protein WA996_18885, partial [Candidatus Promineifilaceae bacterium]